MLITYACPYEEGSIFRIAHVNIGFELICRRLGPTVTIGVALLLFVFMVFSLHFNLAILNTCLSLARRITSKMVGILYEYVVS
jgi:hypothetical protein